MHSTSDVSAYQVRDAPAQSKVTAALLSIFVWVCVFDPADRLIGGKVWVFVALCAVTLYASARQRRETIIPVGLIVYTAGFVAIPLLAICHYYLLSGAAPFAGFALFKSYLLISLALVLTLARLDCIPLMSAALAAMAGATIAVFTVLQIDPSLFLPFHDLGEKYGVVSISVRDYGGITVSQITFATAPMLAIAIPHYLDRTINEVGGRARYLNAALLAVCIAGMFIAGLRNTMAVAVFLPFVIWPLYTRQVVRNEVLSLAAVAVAASPFIGRLQAFLDPSELSNGIKLKFLKDYAVIFTDPSTLLFGQGLGAYYRWSASGLPNFESTGANFYFITELTYLEMIRGFGLIGAACMMIMLLYPIWWAFAQNTSNRRRALAVGYLAYLGMCATNPLLFSSLGMLILSSLVANTFLPERESACSPLRSWS